MNTKKLAYAYSFLRKQLIHLNLQLLYSCNFKCKICDFWKEPYARHPHLSVDQAKIISEKLKPLGPLVVSIGGGEPLLHKNLIEIIQIMAKDNFPVMICNGWYITPENAKELFRAGLHEVSISVDYASAEKHDEQRGKKGAFDHAISALETLQKNRAHADQRVHMISVIMDDNIDEVESLIKIAKSIGVTYLITFYSHGRGKKENRSLYTDISKRLLSLQKQYKEFVSIPEYIQRFAEVDNNAGITPCYAGKNLFNIDSQGNVTRCIDMLEDVAGNILTDDLNVIKQNLHNQFKTNACGECWTSCRGSIETLRYGKQSISNLIVYYNMVKAVPLVANGKE